jgi:hypothetical protein
MNPDAAATKILDKDPDSANPDHQHWYTGILKSRGTAWGYQGLLWVGTNVGIALTIPLPRLEGVPIISGKANISYHAHFGPVRSAIF